MQDLDGRDRLSWGDTAFLYLEREGMPLNIGAVSLFQGDIPFDSCVRFIESKLPLIPRYRQRVVEPPLGIGRPLWEYDPHFDIRQHVRRISLRKGTESELKEHVSRILSTNLDRSRPLWDFTVLSGLKRNRTAVLARAHHCLADGIAGIGLLNVLMDTEPTRVPKYQKKPKYAPPSPEDPLVSMLQGLVTSFEDAARQLASAQTAIINIAESLAAGGTRMVEGFSQYAREITTPTERLPFNVVYRGPERFTWAQVRLADVKSIKRMAGVTVNDVILSLLSMAIKNYAEAHSVNTKGRLLRIVVPVNLRASNEPNELGNRISFLPLTLPLDINDPRSLLEAVHDRMQFLKNARAFEYVSLLGCVLGLMPTPVQSWAGPLASRLPLSLCNTICTNIPGPQQPLYLLGHKMLAMYPHVPIGGEMGMNCAVVSYNGNVYFGLAAEVHAMPDVDRLAALLRKDFQEMRAAITRQQSKRSDRVRPRTRSARQQENAAKEESVVLKTEANETITDANDGGGVQKEEIAKASAA